MAIALPKLFELDKFSGINDAGDVLSTKIPYLREAVNVDIDDLGEVLSRRGGFGANLLSGAYHSLWNNLSQTIMLGVKGTSLLSLRPASATEITLRSDLRAGARMDYCEVNQQCYYTNTQVIGIVNANGSLDSLPTVTKLGSAAMPAGQFIDYYEQCLYVAHGGRVAFSEGLDFGRTVPKDDWMKFPGQITLFRSVDKGFFLSFGETTWFLSGSHPSNFNAIQVANYAAIPYTDVRFDAELLGGRERLTGTAMLWMSTKGPCLGLPDGKFFNLALHKLSPTSGDSGTSVIRENRKGFMQFISILQN